MSGAQNFRKVSSVFLRHANQICADPDNTLTLEQSTVRIDAEEEADLSLPSVFDRLVDLVENTEEIDDNLIFKQLAPSEYAMELIAPAFIGYVRELRTPYRIARPNFRSTRYVDCKINITSGTDEYQAVARLEGLPNEVPDVSLVQGHLYNIGIFPIYDLRGKKYALQPLCPRFNSKESLFFEKAELFFLKDDLDTAVDMTAEDFPSVLVMATVDPQNTKHINLNNASGKEVAAALWAWYEAGPSTLNLIFPDARAGVEASFVDLAL